MKEPATLRESYDRYKNGTFLRKEMIGQIVTAIEDLQARVGKMDEAAVGDLTKRVTGLEVGIGNALTKAMDARLAEPKVYASGDFGAVSVTKKRRGRRPKAAQPPAAMNEMVV